MNNTDITEIFNNYIDLLHDTDEGLLVLQNRLNESVSIVSRHNEIGHVTASGLVIHGNKVALVFHNKLQKYIQPGGHIENDISLHEAAKREVEEETGLSVILHPWHVAHKYIPIHIDVHTIPFNEKKQEPAHKHYDFVYVFTTETPDTKLQQSEVSDLKWFSLNSIFYEKLLDSAATKILKLNLLLTPQIEND